jgi:hypothetical protein
MNTNHELRSGFKWTVNECLRLEREYDLLKLSVEEIALLHQRSNYAIMYKLDYEGIADFNELYQQTYPNEASNDDSESEVYDDDEESYQDETQELDDDAESEASKEEDDSESDDDKYDLKHQVRTLTKQLSNLTAIVYKSLIKDSRTGNVLFR